MEREITPDTVVNGRSDGGAKNGGEALLLRDIDADNLTWEQLIDIIPPNPVTNLYWDHTPWRKVKCDRTLTRKLKENSANLLKVKSESDNHMELREALRTPVDRPQEFCPLF